ncbi:SDR family NAD(P)-dependent oxidoreductase [Sphingomonas sp. GB1N7]|uniref:SDR family NAD(P)-dependent oxidoreductase n=1 Tax=Parasphingomonas caseinilytica TaxID=3096158 RepID=UPI002FCB9A9C
MTGKLEGKVALVTGGTSGIGAGAVRRLAADGAHVVFTGSNAEAAAALCDETGAVFRAHRVEDEAGWKTLAAEIAKTHGRLDIAFANAGIEAGDGSIETIALENWHRILGVNLTGAMLTAQAAIGIMRHNPEGPTGSIIINSSMNAHRAMGNFMTYSVSKSALVALTKSIATHCGNQGYRIRCNAILPGVVETDMIRGVIDRAPDPVAARGQFEGMAPLKRMAMVSEIAALVAFLASDEAAFISGSDYVIDGATTAGMQGV